MTITQYKKTIRAMSREELEEHLFGLFSASKVFKDIESSCFSPADNEKLLEQLQKKLDRAFWREHFSLSECKNILKEAAGRCVHQPTVALMQLYFASDAAELSASYGDYGESFYNALEEAAEKYLDYAKTDEEFFKAHEAEFEKLIATSDCLGYGVECDLAIMLEEARFEVYGEKEE